MLAALPTHSQNLGFFIVFDPYPSPNCPSTTPGSATAVIRDKCPYVRPCSPASACIGGNFCAAGYTGLLCASCNIGVLLSLGSLWLHSLHRLLDLLTILILWPQYLFSHAILYLSLQDIASPLPAGLKVGHACHVLRSCHPSAGWASFSSS